MLAAAAPQAKLVVHDVGAFVASYVPSPADFSRLDPRFRLPAVAFAAHPDYRDWGFAVFQLKPRRRPFWGFGGITPQTVHPMAFTFPSRMPRALFYPTLHIHDGATVPARAEFDHHLYCQTDDEVLEKTFCWRLSNGPLGRYVEASRVPAGIIDDGAMAYSTRTRGTQPNEDTFYEAPACSGPHVLSGRGERFAFDVSAYAAYFTWLDDPRNRAWRDTARSRLDELHAGLLEGLRHVTTENAAAWRLASFPDGEAKCPPGLMEETFRPVTDRVQQQNIRLIFREAPSAELKNVILGELVGVLGRAVP
jgi:hypothetical protein